MEADKKQEGTAFYCSLLFFKIRHDDMPQVETELNILILSDLPLCCQDD